MWLKALLLDLAHMLSLSTFLPLIGGSTHCTSGTVLICYPPNSYTAHFNPLFQNVHLPLLSNLFHYSIKCHTLLNTPTRSSLIQPYSPCSSPTTLTLSVQHPAPHSFQTPASVRPSAAALCDESCGEYFPHELGLLTLVVRLGRCYD